MAARRRGDEAAHAAIDVQLIGALIDADRLDEACNRLRELLQAKLDWPSYAAAGALRADELIGRMHLPHARAWVSSLMAEARLRKEAVPAGVRARLAQLDFWQGRDACAQFAPAPLCDADEVGWRALRAWSCSDLARVVACCARLPAWPVDSSRPACWFGLLRLLLAGSVATFELDRQVAELRRLVAGEPSRRMRRLAAVVAAAAWLRRGETAPAGSLLRSISGPGPEAVVAVRLKSEWLSGQKASRRVRHHPASRSGRECNMHLINGCPACGGHGRPQMMRRCWRERADGCAGTPVPREWRSCR
jgi:hypothetical protein